MPDLPKRATQEPPVMRTIKLCATPRSTTLLEAIRRSAVELERTGRTPRPLPTTDTKPALA